MTWAVRTFWQSRGNGSSALGGREAVVGGKNMDGFINIVRAVAAHCGLADEAVHVRKSQVVLPDFFRATKSRDALVVDHGHLPGVFEFKSQVGSFGNNLNNRAEEMIGSAADP